MKYLSIYRLTRYKLSLFTLIYSLLLISCNDGKTEKKNEAKSDSEIKQEIISHFRDSLTDTYNANKLSDISSKYSFKVQEQLKKNNKVILKLGNVIDIVKIDSLYLIKFTYNRWRNENGGKEFLIYSNKTDFNHIWTLMNIDTDSTDRQIFLVIELFEARKHDFTVHSKYIDSEYEVSSGRLELDYLDNYFVYKGRLIDYAYIDLKQY